MPLTPEQKRRREKQKERARLRRQRLKEAAASPDSAIREHAQAVKHHKRQASKHRMQELRNNTPRTTRMKKNKSRRVSQRTDDSLDQTAKRPRTSSSRHAFRYEDELPSDSMESSLGIEYRGNSLSDNQAIPPEEPEDGASMVTNSQRNFEDSSQENSQRNFVGLSQGNFMMTNSSQGSFHSNPSQRLVSQDSLTFSQTGETSISQQIDASLPIISQDLPGTQESSGVLYFHVTPPPQEAYKKKVRIGEEPIPIQMHVEDHNNFDILFNHPQESSVPSPRFPVTEDKKSQCIENVSNWKKKSNYICVACDAIKCVNVDDPTFVTVQQLRQKAYLYSVQVYCTNSDICSPEENCKHCVDMLNWLPENLLYQYDIASIIDESLPDEEQLNYSEKYQYFKVTTTTGVKTLKVLVNNTEPTSSSSLNEYLHLHCLALSMNSVRQRGILYAEGKVESLTFPMCSKCFNAYDNNRVGKFTIANGNAIGRFPNKQFENLNICEISLISKMRVFIDLSFKTTPTGVIQSLARVVEDIIAYDDDEMLEKMKIAKGRVEEGGQG